MTILSAVNIALTVTLSVLVYLNNRKNTKRVAVYNAVSIVNTMFRIEQELKAIYRVFYAFLVSIAKDKFSKFDLAEDWREKLSSISSYIPADVISEIYSIYVYCEKCNNSKIKNNFQLDVFDYVELNYIEYITINTSNYLARKEVSFYFKLVKFITKDDKSILDTRLKIINEENLKVSYNQNNINEYSYIENVNDYRIASSYNQWGLHSQIVTYKNTEVRDIKICDGRVSGKDSFKINPSAVYYKNYRGVGNMVIVSDATNPNFYEGNLSQNLFDGVGKIIQKGFIHIDGHFCKGSLVNGKRYNVEYNRKYNNPEFQKKYSNKHYTNVEYEMHRAKAAENSFQDMFGYISYAQDYEVKNGVSEPIKNTVKETECADWNLV